MHVWLGFSVGFGALSLFEVPSPEASYCQTLCFVVCYKSPPCLASLYDCFVIYVNPRDGPSLRFLFTSHATSCKNCGRHLLVVYFYLPQSTVKRSALRCFVFPACTQN